MNFVPFAVFSFCQLFGCLDRGKERERDWKSVQLSVSHKWSTLMSHRHFTFNKTETCINWNSIAYDENVQNVLSLFFIDCHFWYQKHSRNVSLLLFFPLFFLILSQFLVWSVARVDAIDVCDPHFMLHFYCYVWFLYLLIFQWKNEKRYYIFFFFFRKQ